MSDKPSSCKTCPLYSAKREPGVSTEECSVLILGGSPPKWGGFFSDKPSMIVKSAIREIALDAMKNSQDPLAVNLVKLERSVRLLYAVQCGCDKITKEASRNCFPNIVTHQILLANPKVIVSLGKEVLTILGIDDDLTRVRGHILSVNIGGKIFKLIPSVSPVAIMEKITGAYHLLKADITSAALIDAREAIPKKTFEELTSHVLIPKTIEEIDALSAFAANYAAPGLSPDKTLISLDYEATSLYPWRFRHRCLTLSVSLDDGQTISFPIDHRSVPIPKDDLVPYIFRILMSPHPKTWHNFKYDLGCTIALVIWLKNKIDRDRGYRAKFESISGHTLEAVLAVNGVVNTQWDSLLGEHLLNEDKKGWNSLKTIITDYFPEYTGYQDTLKESIINMVVSELEEELSNTDIINPEMDEFLPAFLHGKKFTKYSERLQYAEEMLGKIKAALKKADNTNILKKLINSRTQVMAYIAYSKDIAKSLASAYRKTISAVKTALTNDNFEEYNITYEYAEYSILCKYAGIDVDLTRKITKIQRKLANLEDPIGPDTSRRRLIHLMNNHYIPITKATTEMQFFGVQYSGQYATTTSQMLQNRVFQEEAEMLEILQEDLGALPSDINFNSTETIANILVGGYGFKSEKQTKSGKMSMDESVIESLAATGNRFASKYLSFKKDTKALSTYVDGFTALAKEDNLIHGAVSVNGTVTGRSSSEHPNLQNIPVIINGTNIKKLLRTSNLEDPEWWKYPHNIFLAAMLGWNPDTKLVFVDLDFAGAEIRVLTRYCPDENLIAALKEGKDIHCWMTAEIHGLEYDYVFANYKSNKEIADLRQSTKQVVFGILYGISAKGLAERMGFTEQKATQLIEKLFTRFPTIRKYVNETKLEIRNFQKVQTPYGRFRRFPLVRFNRWALGEAERQGVNFKIQSYCSDIVMSCLYNLHKNLRDIHGRLLLTVHDSICFEFPIEYLKDLKKFLQKYITDHIAEKFPDMPVVMPFDLKIGFNYGETMKPKDFYEKNGIIVV